MRRLGLGAMSLTGRGVWGEPADPDGARRLLRRALELGVDFVDTADSYGPEVSERLIAEALHPYPEGLVVATKAGFRRSGPARVGSRRPPGAPARGLRGQPAQVEAGADRPLPAARRRSRRPARGVARRARRAAGRGQGPPRRRLQRRPRAARTCTRRRAGRLRPEPLQPRRPRARAGAAGVRARRAGVRGVGAAREGLPRAGGRRRRARLAAPPLAGAPADPRDGVGRAPRAERPRAQARARRRTARAARPLPQPRSSRRAS